MHGLTPHRPLQTPGLIGHVARHRPKAEISASKETQCRK
jgi:hypothetical protein